MSRIVELYYHPYWDGMMEGLVYWCLHTVSVDLGDQFDEGWLVF